MSGVQNSRLETLLLMGSKAFKAQTLPVEIITRLNAALDRNMRIIVGEAPGANHVFQDYLASQNYRNVLVGHARSIRYNAGNWETKQYGDNVREREKGMISECDEAIIIWVNNSSVIATNLERLKELGIPTFLYEYSQSTQKAQAGMLDPSRTYDPNYRRYKYFKRKNASNYDMPLNG